VPQTFADWLLAIKKLKVSEKRCPDEPPSQLDTADSEAFSVVRTTRADITSCNARKLRRRDAADQRIGQDVPPAFHSLGRRAQNRGTGILALRVAPCAGRQWLTSSISTPGSMSNRGRHPTRFEPTRSLASSMAACLKRRHRRDGAASVMRRLVRESRCRPKMSDSCVTGNIAKVGRDGPTGRRAATRAPDQPHEPHLLLASDSMRWVDLSCR
jgi:hypothetical protein